MSEIRVRQKLEQAYKKFHKLENNKQGKEREI